MNMRTYLIPVLAAGLLWAGPAIAQKKTGAAPKSGNTAANLPAPKKITSVEGFTEYELANGLRVLLFPDPSQPKITVNITYKVGSRQEGYGESGMAHLLEHMLFKGSTKHPNIPQELTTHGASPNGTTWLDRTNYFETFNATDENLNWALSLESDRMINSFIRAEDLASEFTVVRNEFERGENNPSSILMERILSSAYLWHNYGKSTIGSKEDIERVPIENLRAFYKKYYQPDNAVLLVAGKIDEAKTLDLINKYFGPIPRPTRVLQKDYTVEPVQDGERFVELRRAGDVQSLGMAYHISSGSHPDYPAIDVLNEVLTNEPNGRLYQAMVKSGKATGVWGFPASLHDPGFYYLAADVLKEKSLDSAKMAMFQTIAELNTKPVTADEVEKARTKLMSDFESVFRNTQRISTLMSEFIGMGDWRLFFLYRDQLKKVTADDVNRVARNYMIPSNRTYGMFIPTNNAQRAIIPPTPNVAELVGNYKGGQAMAAGEAFDATPENIDNRTVRGSLMGGGKFALLSKKTRGNVVEARITLRLGDESSMKNKGTIAELTADMLPRGTKSRSMAQINEALDKLKSKVNIGAQGQTVAIVITSTHDNLPAVLDIVDDMLHNPAFQPDEFKTLTDEYVSGLEQERSEPMSIAGREFNRILSPYPKGDIRGTMSYDEEIAAVKGTKLDELKQFYQDYYNGSSATVAVVGDFDPDGTRQKLEKMLGNWTAIKSYTRAPEPYQQIAPQNQELKTPDKKNAMFFAGTAIKMRDDNPDYPALAMANFMFGGGFLNSRLATRIRQKEGISYGVGSFLQPSSQDENGVFGAYAIYNPENKSKLEEVYKEELNKALTEGFTQEELDMAKNGFIQSRQTGRANDAQLAAKLNQYAYLGRTMNWDAEMDAKLQKLTVQEVNAAMKKYVDPKNFTYIKAGDFK